MSYLSKTSEGLLPCPFCGGEARMHVAFASGGDHSVGVYVECLECRSWSGTKWGDGAQEKAAEAWNRRAERTCRMVDCSTTDTCVVNRELCNGDVMSMEFGYKQCSECGAYVFDCPTVRYCPSCGAKVVDE